MTTLSTHDTKRGEDVRARIDVLSEMPDGMGGDRSTQLRRLAPLGDGPLENLLWQAIVGAWPASPERLHAYAEKAAREAGDSTSWTAPDDAFEARMHALVDAAFDDERVATARRPASPARDARLVATRCRPSCSSSPRPGVPDVYQGSELWETSLVDPDNRRPVDFDAAPPHARRARRRRAARGRRAAARPSCSSRPGRCGSAATGPSCSPAYPPLDGIRRGGRPCSSPSTAAARSRSPPACRSASQRAAAGATRRSCSAARPVATSSPAGTLDGRRAAARRAARHYPVALLVDRGEDWHDLSSDVWAPRATGSTLRSTGTTASDDAEPATDGGRRRTRGDGRRLRLPHRRRRDAAARPAVAPPAGRRARARPRVFDPGAHAWTRRGWTGRSSPAASSTSCTSARSPPEGTLDAAIERLDHLVELGVDFVELLPVNAFNGTHNWGYDGVLWYAVHEAYGGPAAYQRFVDACHARGLARDPGRRLQPPRPERELPARVRAVPARRPRQHLGLVGQPRRPTPTGARATSSTTR